MFWDDVLVLPLLTYRLPELTEELIGYRYRRLGAARRLAAEHGCRGALFPWQSGSDGREETPTRIFNPRSGRWFADHSRLQRHVNLAVAYNVWQHYEVTDDVEFLANYGAELLIEIARFFSSLAVFNPDRGRYEIRGVMGPDEYHDAYLGADRPGIDNNAYTNVMVVWLMHRAIDTLAVLHGYHCDELVSALAVDPAEVERWTDITSKMFVPFHEGVISQFEGYEKLERARLGRVPDALRQHRSIGSDPGGRRRHAQSLQAVQASGHADAVLPAFGRRAARAVRGSGLCTSAETILATVDYYLARTSHGSTLSRVVDAWILARSDRRRSWSSFNEALAADVADTQGGTTAEGIHLGAMAGTLDIVQRCYTGLEARDGVLWLNPRLPTELGFIDLQLLYRQQWLSLRITDREVRITAPAVQGESDPYRRGRSARGDAFGWQPHRADAERSRRARVQSATGAQPGEVAYFVRVAASLASACFTSRRISNRVRLRGHGAGSRRRTAGSFPGERLQEQRIDRAGEADKLPRAGPRLMACPSRGPGA